METEKPTRGQVAMGVVLVALAALGVGYLLTHPDAQGNYAWGAVGIMGFAGFWLWVPVKALTIWHEIRAALPILADPPADDGHNHG